MRHRLAIACAVYFMPVSPSFCFLASASWRRCSSSAERSLQWRCRTKVCRWPCLAAKGRAANGTHLLALVLAPGQLIGVRLALVAQLLQRLRPQVARRLRLGRELQQLLAARAQKYELTGACASSGVSRRSSLARHRVASHPRGSRAPRGAAAAPAPRPRPPAASTAACARRSAPVSRRPSTIDWQLQGERRTVRPRRRAAGGRARSAAAHPAAPSCARRQRPRAAAPGGGAARRRPRRSTRCPSARGVGSAFETQQSRFRKPHFPD